MTDNRTTELLHKLLDERGVKWWEGEDERKTHWVANGLTWEYFNNENGDAWLGFLEVCESDVSPEQAIAATLGSDSHPYEQRITGDGSDWGEIMIDAYDDLMAAACESCTPEQMAQLADHIRAELGSGTCKCGWRGFVDSWGYEPPNYCPRCGGEVVSE